MADTDIAIVGMSGRFPGADDVESFWRMLSAGKEGITRFTREELVEAGVPTSLLDDPSYVPAHGVLPDVDLFDTGYFELTPAEAGFTDPQHRILLTTGHAALENAGYDPARFDGLISVYAGAAINTYLQQQILPNVDQTTTSNHFAVMVGNDKDFLATRLSYKLDLRGPSYTVQTACSTSLVAIHLACQGLINGECDMALAGGVTVKVPQTKGYLYEEGAILSKDGHVRTFDAEASGTVLGNGVGVVVLKLLSDAIADRDTIHAVIKGTATNNDGSGKVSFAAPGAAGQTAVIREAHAVAGIDPRSLSYVEAHGTATRLGDPVEVSALTKAFAASTSDTGFCSIGSVKSNVGHLDAAAGVAGVIKTAMMMKHRSLVPTLNYEVANSAINFAATPFSVCTATTPWSAQGPLRAGVSSFGIGGTNAHAVLEEAPAPGPVGRSREHQVLVVSARSRTALEASVRNVAQYLQGDDVAALADVAYTLAVGRRAHEFRVAVAGSDPAALADALRSAPLPQKPQRGAVAFAFSEEVDNGAALAQRWCQAESMFAEHYEAAVAAGAGDKGERGTTFALQYALGRLWLGWGVKPVAIFGDGLAARVAACVIEAMTLSEAIASLDTSTPIAGRTASSSTAIALKSAQEETDAVVLRATDGPWGAVARAWQAGAEVDWLAWFGDEQRGRVPLPTYPFEGRRCWMTGSGSVSTEPSSRVSTADFGPHPMLDENISTLETVAFRSARTGSEFYLADHRVGGEPVMPAVGYLELARAAGELSLGGGVQLRNISFGRVLSYAAGPRTVVVSLRRNDDDGVGFQVAQDDSVYASGQLRPHLGESPRAIELAAIEGRCPEIISHHACYSTLRACGLDYGPRMRALAEVALGDGEAVARLELPEGASIDGATLNPALLDGALHALVVLLARSYREAAGGFLPMALGELTVHRPLVGPCRVHVTIDERGNRSARAQITVLDTAGQVLAELSELAVRVLREPARSALLVRRWIAGPTEAGSVAASGEGLVLASGGERQTTLCATVKSVGVSEVSAASPASIEVIGGSTGLVIVDEPEAHHVLRVVKGLLRAGRTQPTRVLLLHRHEAEGARPERAALAGLARAVRAENPRLVVQVVGLASGVDERTAIETELCTEGADVEVCYGPQGRQIPSFEAAPATQPIAIGDGRVYVITGAGGLGQLVAQWLLDRADVRVVMLSRGVSAPAGLHTRAAYRQADVSDVQVLREALASVRAEFGSIDGVIHTAGVLRDSFALNKSEEDFSAVLAPKVEGLQALRRATADDSLDFFVAFSSIAAHIGSQGQIDYAYANAFLEAYAERHEGITAVAWPMWAEGGMRQSPEAAAEIATRTGFGVLPTEVGLALLEQALGVAGPCVAAYGETTRIATMLGAPLHVVAPTQATDSNVDDDVDLRGEALAVLRTLIAAQTGLEPAELQEDASLDRYGIDSLVITKLNRELDRRFEGLSKTLFFEYSTLGELADFFAENYAAELRPEGATQGTADTATVAPSRTATIVPSRPTAPADDAIAVIGLAGRYPLADDLDEFWTNLVDGRDCITEIPDDRWDRMRWFDPDPVTLGRAHTRWGGFLRDVDRFDPLFFGISPRHAELMDPQERLFLQNAWHVVEDAGYRRRELADRAVGVYVGVMYGEYQFHGAVDVLRGGRALTSSSFATIANRVSYALNLSGPSLALDTMCSSSLTAIHLACESLRRGETELAIAGGVNVSIHPYKYAFLSQGRFLSSDGRCRAFGAGGDGYVPGEGVGAVLLKPYAQALADGDRIYGVVRGSALNHGGRTNGYTVPNPRAQQKVINTAMEQAGVSPDEIDYVEAHGTGTSLGDPIELTGLTKAYKGADASSSWPIGSVKSNVGHLESAAGIAGLTKVLLQFTHGALVPSLHSADLNPNIDFGSSPFRVQRERAPWPKSEGPRRAGLSSFGAGGSNAHLVLEESARADAVANAPVARQSSETPVAFVLSARDEERLRVYAATAVEFLKTQPIPLADLCFTTQVGREPMDARVAVLATRGEEIVAALQRLADEGVRPEISGGGSLGDLARRWCGGEDVDWAAWHASRSEPGPRRCRAPLYPFANDRYWVPLDADLGTAALHPLIDANESTVDELRFRKTLRRTDPLLRDHEIDGRVMFAGAATLELVRVAAQRVEPGKRHALREVVWGRAIELREAELDLYVSFVSATERLEFEVYSSAAGERVTHVRGSAVPTMDTAPTTVDLQALRSRLAPTGDRATVYADYQAAGFDYGASFQVMDEIRSGPAEALVRISGDASDPQLGLPPGLLDGALRACHWVGRTQAPTMGDLEVPFSLGALEVFAPLTSVCYAHAQLAGESGGIRRFHLVVYDEQGHALVSIRDFAGRIPSESAATTPIRASREGGQGRFYAPCWREAAEPELGDTAQTLVLVGGAQIESSLRATGLWHEVVRIAESDPQTIARALVGLATSDGVDLAFVEGVDEGSAFTPNSTSADRLDTVFDRTCFAMLEVLRAVDTVPLRRRVRCVLVHAQDDGQDRPERGALAGFGRSTVAIAPRFELLTLGVPRTMPPAELASAVATELRVAPRCGGLEVRRTEAGTREVRALQAVREPGSAASPLREGGVYVVTGASGAIGQVLCEHLATTYRAKLVLVGRSPFERRADQWPQTLTDKGAEVLTVQADVARADQLDAALKAARGRFGALDGVFHLAGVADDGRALDGDRDRFARVLAAKTRGLVNLDLHTRDDALDLFVMFSSISSLIGDFGAASYATANRFADLYIERRQSWVDAGARHGRSLALAWPLWGVGGVDGLVREQEHVAYTHRSGMQPLTAEQGIAVMEGSFGLSSSWVIPAWGDRATMDTALLGAPRPTSAAVVASVAAPVRPSAQNGARPRLVDHLCGVLSGVLKLPAGKLDSRVALEDYGLDSVLVMESNSLLEKDFGGLRGTVFFECRTVEQLADHLLAEHAADVARMFPAPSASVSAPSLPSTPPTPPTPSPACRPASPAAVPSSRSEVDEPIAIIGASGRYPQARDLNEFWENLSVGRQCVTEIPSDRWDADAFFDPDPTAAGRSYSRWGGFLSDVDAFDSLFFQIAPKQARSMDPQERLFLETAWSALEDAGYPPSRIPAPKFGGKGHDVGVFVGVMWDDYAVLAATESARGNHQVVLANRASIANQVSYFGDFRGPSVVVDTACSASLVAVHQACESLRRGECSYAIAGGVNVAAHPDKYVHLSRKTMLSADGRCRAFGAGANGYVPGEGVGAVVLKRLSEAVRDGDTVHAVIRATAVNHGGRTSGFTVPNPHAQQALVEEALSNAGISARTIGCVEAHGTGTSLGDPIEHTALAQAFAKDTQDLGFCALGSVKSSIGHLEGAAGIAGLTKAMLQLEHKVLLPTLHTKELNPIIDFSRSPFVVQRDKAPWAQPQDASGRPTPRRASVSSFGAGGTNAYVVLEEFESEVRAAQPQGPELIVLSARDESRLREYAATVGRALAQPDARRLADVGYTLRIGREPMAERLAFVATDLPTVAATLTAFGRGELSSGLHRGQVKQHPPLAGLFTDSNGGGDFLTAQIDAGEYDLLARLWVSGITLDWDVMHSARPGDRRRISLPSYPFERARHWLALGERSVPVAASSRRTWQRGIDLGAPVLRDHVVEGRPILPGVGHLDLIAEACGGLVGQALGDVRWVRPLAADGSELQVSVTFDGDRCEVRGGRGEECCSQARLVEASPRPPALDIAALQASMERGPQGDAFYRMLEGQGLPYGPFFRRVEQVWVGAQQVLGQLGPAADEADHPLHPGVLDAALHTIAVLLVQRRGAHARPMLPFAADRVDVFGPVPTRGWSWVRETGPDRCDVLLADESGTVQVRLSGVAYREAKLSTVTHCRPTWVAQPAEGTAEPARSVLLIGATLEREPAAGIAQEHRDADIRRLSVGPAGLSDDALDRVLGEGYRPDLVYFFGAEPSEDPHDRAGLHAVMNHNVLSLYRTVRAFDRHGLLDRDLRLKVVTTDVQPLGSDDRSRPWSAGVLGLAMVASKEFPSLRVSLVDVRSTEAADAAASVVEEPFPAKTLPISLRAGVRRVRTLERVDVPPSRSAFRDGGVYLIIGGLGAVGRDTCHYLAKRYGATLVVVGRSALDDSKRATIAELTKAGARVRYLAVDATDPAALRGAVADAKREFGALHGVINAAMVLVNRVVRDLDESSLRAALESKTDSTWSVLKAVAEESLDFVLLYSSGVAFEGNHGQAGYAAGCTFADAYALHAARRMSFPVRVLNLGYWHAGGDEERERVLQRLKAVGIRPMTAEQGMAAVERVLGGDLPQVLALDADARILEDMGVEPECTVTVSQGEAPSASPKVRLGHALSDPELALHQRVVSEAEALSLRLLAAALRRLGVFDRLVRPLRRANLVAGLGIVPEHAELFDVQLDALIAGGYLRTVGEQLQDAKRPAELESEVQLAAQTLLSRHPGIAPLVSLLCDCMAVLPEVLTGQASAMKVLFPGGSYERVAALYKGDPITDRCNQEIARLIVAQVEARRATASDGRVRILEVGSGTGGTSTAVLAALDAYAESVDYVFTDVSRAFVSKGRGRFGAQHPFARFELLDIEGDLRSQGLDLGTYDVVFGTNVFHATRRLSDTVTQAKRLLRRGGVLLLTEGTRHQHQLALIFGLTPGWWLFADPAQRLPGSPLSSEQQWRDILTGCGFGSIEVGSPTTDAGAAFQSVIAAVSDGLVPSVPASTAVSAEVAPSPLSSPSASEPSVAASAGLEESLAQVTAVFARVLEMPTAQLDPDLTFENYGVDSLVALDLTRGLEAVYGPLSSTLLFERITMRRLAEYFHAERSPQPSTPKVETRAVPASSRPVSNGEASSGHASNGRADNGRAGNGHTDDGHETGPQPPRGEIGGRDAESIVASLPDAVVDELLAELLAQRGGSRNEAQR